MDIKIKCDEGNFKFRVSGILKNEDKYLVVKINDNNFYCLPGGHVELGEDTNTAILREMAEELGFEVNIEKMVCVVQNFFKGIDGKCFHELGWYYVVSPKDISQVNTKDYVRFENDKGKIQKLDFKWATLEELKDMDFRPKEIINEITKENFSNIIKRD